MLGALVATIHPAPPQAMRRRNQTADGASIAAGVNRAADINPGTAMEAMGVAMKTVMVMEAMMMATAGGRGAGDERVGRS